MNIRKQIANKQRQRESSGSDLYYTSNNDSSTDSDSNDGDISSNDSKDIFQAF